MKTQQKALIVRTCPDSVHGLDELNVQLNRGWRVRHVAPMGAAGIGAQDQRPALHFAAIVIIESTDQNAAALQEAEEQIGSLLEEITEGDGSTVKIDDPEP